MAGTSSLSALIADDNEDNRNICRIIMEKSGISVMEAINGEEAIRLLSRHQFNLLLLDLQMPVIDGRGVVHWLGEHADHRPRNVVILTANPRWVTDELQDAVDFVMNKPIATAEFTQFVRRLVSSQLTV